jgi:putative transposase
MEYRRLYQSGARYFFTVVTENREPLLIRLRAAFRYSVT